MAFCPDCREWQIMPEECLCSRCGKARRACSYTSSSASNSRGSSRCSPVAAEPAAAPLLAAAAAAAAAAPLQIAPGGQRRQRSVAGYKDKEEINGSLPICGGLEEILLGPADKDCRLDDVSEFGRLEDKLFEASYEAYRSDDTTLADPRMLLFCNVATRLAAQMNKDRREKSEASNQEDAYLGDALNDVYVALRGTELGLSAHQMNRVRTQELSANGLSSGLGKQHGRAIAEEIEAQVGRAVKCGGRVFSLANSLEFALKAARVPPSDEELHSKLERALLEASSEGDREQRPRATNIVLVEEDPEEDVEC